MCAQNPNYLLLILRKKSWRIHGENCYINLIGGNDEQRRRGDRSVCAPVADRVECSRRFSTFGRPAENASR